MELNLREKAESLRQKGHTYKEISQLLNGAVSVDWCKRNLKEVKKEKLTDACIEELILKATRPEGITVYEANSIIFKHNKDKNLSKDQIKNIRKKASTSNTDCLFRPAWVSPTAPVESYKTFLAYASHLIDELDNMTRWYCDTYPNTNQGAVRYELTKHLFPKISAEPLHGRMMRTEVVIEELESRKIDSVVIGEELALDTEDTSSTQTDYKVRDEDLYPVVEISEQELDDIWK